ncbi:Uncharacterised protein [Cedecea neteri]|uniref:Uncharacterized protein n=1 Tax=Cedecea neteri TaxID=158822 RepID=A0A291E3F7_9ENTR|nr:hypothetical protein CO704_21540 [Cedecea neteri]SQA97919.1 Uncharacterised protein [Cedecea neteri]
MQKLKRLRLIRSALRLGIFMLSLFILWIMFVSSDISRWTTLHPQASMFIMLFTVAVYCATMVCATAINESINIWSSISDRLKNLLLCVEKDVLAYPDRAEDCRLMVSCLKSRKFFLLNIWLCSSCPDKEI